jgi:hypothetical protein
MVPFVQALFGILTVIAMADGLPSNPKVTSSSSLAAGPSNIVSEICTSPSAHFNAVELQIASLFCTVFLKVKPTTVTGELALCHERGTRTYGNRYRNSCCHCYDSYYCHRNHHLDRF